MAGRRQDPMRIICRMNPDLRQLHLALMDLVGILNRPQPGLVLLREAGISLDRALFQLLVRIERRGPIGIVDLAETSGRDYTTVSRQVNKLESMGLVSRRTGAVDRRTREVVPTRAGLAMTGEVDRARDKLMTAIFAKWSSRDLREGAPPFIWRRCQKHHLWRAVDHEGEILEACGTKTQDIAAALKSIKAGGPYSNLKPKEIMCIMPYNELRRSAALKTQTDAM
jgi:DNA-binding MarR family transcriptional regulator